MASLLFTRQAARPCLNLAVGPLCPAPNLLVLSLDWNISPCCNVASTAARALNCAACFLESLLPASLWGCGVHISLTACSSLQTQPAAAGSWLGKEGQALWKRDSCHLLLLLCKQSLGRGGVFCPQEGLQAHRKILWSLQATLLHPACTSSAYPTSLLQKSRKKLTAGTSSWVEIKGERGRRDSFSPWAVPTPGITQKNLQPPSFPG